MSYITLEIGSLGHYKIHAIKDLQSFTPNLSKASASSILHKLARVPLAALLTSLIPGTILLGQPGTILLGQMTDHFLLKSMYTYSFIYLTLIYVVVFL